MRKMIHSTKDNSRGNLFMRKSYEEFLHRLSQYRLYLNMTQEDIGSVLGITQSQFSKMELGKTIVLYKSLKCLMKEGWDIDFLMTGKEFVRKESELVSLIKNAEEEHKPELLYAVAWLLEQGIFRNNSDLSFETRCELEVLKIRATGCHSESVLYEVRKIFGISQVPMAEKLGVNIKKYRMLEKRKSDPDAELLIRIYEVTGCKPSLLIDLGNVDNVIIDDLWQQIEYSAQKKILMLSKQILWFLKT